MRLKKKNYVATFLANLENIGLLFIVAPVASTYKHKLRL